MKYAFLINSMEKSGGTERVVANLANRWAERGDDITIITAKEYIKSFYKLSPKVKIKSLGIEELPSLSVSTICLLLLNYTKIILRLYKYLYNNHIDTLLTIWVHMSVCGIISGRIAKCRVFACEHIWYYSPGIVWRGIRRAIYPFANGVVSLTKVDQALYERFSKNVTTIPNALTFCNAKKSECVNKQIISIGRLSVQKGFDMLIEAWSKVISIFPEWKLNIVGDGEEYDKLLGLIKFHQCQSSIAILSPTKEIEKCYLNSSVYVMSSRFEGLPMVLLEAMSFGLPIISFDCPTGPNEVIEHKKNGILVPPGNISSLADALILLMSDEELRKNYGHYSKVKSLEYFPDVIDKRWDEYLKSVE